MIADILNVENLIVNAVSLAMLFDFVCGRSDLRYFCVLFLYLFVSFFMD